MDRWVPCPDHRDKTQRRYCYLCEELTEAEIMERQVRRRLWNTDLGRWRLTLIDILEQQRDRKG